MFSDTAYGPTTVGVREEICFLFVNVQTIMTLIYICFTNNSPDPMKPEAVGICGMIEIQEKQRFKITAKEVPLQISRLHIVQVCRFLAKSVTFHVLTILGENSRCTYVCLPIISRGFRGSFANWFILGCKELSLKKIIKCMACRWVYQ
jgi:hypothetical protein